MAEGIRIRKGAQSGTLGAALTNVETTITFAAAPNFSTLGTDEYIALILDENASENGPEIVHLTTYTAAATTGTIARGMEGTTAVAHSNGEDWLHGPTVKDFDDLVDGRNGGREVVKTIAASGTTPDLDLIDGNVFDVTLDNNATFTFSSAVSGFGIGFTLILRQDATGGRTVTWPASVKWDSGTAPTLGTAANNISLLTFYTVDGGTTWLGGFAGDGFA